MPFRNGPSRGSGGDRAVRAGAELTLADTGKRRLCLDFSRTGVLRQSPRALRATRPVSEPPGSRCCLRAGKTKSCDPGTLGDHVRQGPNRARAEAGQHCCPFSSRCPDAVSAEDRQAHATGYVKALVKSPRGLALDLSGRVIGPGPRPTDARAPLTGSPSATRHSKRRRALPKGRVATPLRPHRRPLTATNQDIAIARPH